MITGGLIRSFWRGIAIVLLGGILGTGFGVALDFAGRPEDRVPVAIA